MRNKCGYLRIRPKARRPNMSICPQCLGQQACTKAEKSYLQEQTNKVQGPPGTRKHHSKMHRLQKAAAIRATPARNTAHYNVSKRD